MKTLTVGDQKILDQVPHADELVYVFKTEDREAISKALHVPANSFTGALIKVCSGIYETVWLSQELRSFDLNANYCLVKHEGHVL